jgi:hypothetical protein
MCVHNVHPLLYFQIPRKFTKLNNTKHVLSAATWLHSTTFSLPVSSVVLLKTHASLLERNEYSLCMVSNTCLWFNDFSQRAANEFWLLEVGGQERNKKLRTVLLWVITQQVVVKSTTRYFLISFVELLWFYELSIVGWICDI